VFAIFDLCSFGRDFQLVGVSTDGSARESGCQEVCTAKSPSSCEPLADPKKNTTPPDTGMLDIVLVSRHAGTVNHDAVCSLLTKCLQDVSSATLAMPY
jgi:hypothetical protein